MNIDRKKLIISALLGCAALILFTGITAVYGELDKKREIGRRIIASERAIEKLARDNAELSVKIAEQINPAHLTRRASARLAMPRMTAVVWGYENYDGGRIDFSGRSKGLVSFRAPEKKKLAER
ncbi:MAG: hypothetical protein IJI37_02415 [Opitutales bacterium]|nr:hypothetical protein [Opitutales bacterium]